MGLTESHIGMLDRHFDLLVHWNRRLNLTRIVDPDVASTRHYGESLFLAAHLTAGTVIDVGSGAGFPGIPAAVLRPECRFILLESDRRKAVFLREASRELANVRVVCERAEEFGENADWIISRAVAPPEVMGLRLAPRIALLLANSDAGTIEGLQRIPLPWGAGVLAIGQRAHTVPRGKVT